ncbi:MAG: alpha/beta hydrolase family protein [Promethearchaeota archaeon]
MIKEVKEIEIRSEILHGILYLPDDRNSQSEENHSYPIIINISGMPGKSPEENEIRFAHPFIDSNIAFFSYDHQGVRNSTGIFTYHDAHANIERVIDLLVYHPKINPLKIGLLGESFGGAMAFCHAIRDRRIQCLAIRSPVFDTEIVPKNPLFKFFIKALTRNKEMRFPEGDIRNMYAGQTRQYNPDRLADKLVKPFYLIAGNKDVLFPEYGFNQLFNKVSSNIKSIDIIDGANHNFTDKNHFQLLREKLLEFFSTHLL